MSARLRLVAPISVPTPDPPREPSVEERLREIRAKKPESERWLVERYGGRVERILLRVLGNARNLEDLVQEVFVRVFARAGELREPAALGGFIASIAVFVAREAIRSRRRQRWLRFFAAEDLPDPPAVVDPEGREAVGAIYRVLGELGTDERICFALRYVDGMTLADVAIACGWSLSTTKRRLKDAETAFVARCREDDALRPWLEAGDRWT